MTMRQAGKNTESMKELESESVENSELVEQTFNFWFNSQNHIRSPFPNYIRPELQRRSIERFFEGSASLTEKAKDEVNEEIIGEKFEEIIFEIALGLVRTEDEKISINYPFLPRRGDKIEDKDATEKAGSSVIKDRSIVKEGDKIFLKVKLERANDKTRWETMFELPA